MCCMRKVSVALRGFLILISLFNLAAGCFGIYSYSISGENIKLNIVAPFLAIVIGVFGIVAISKRNLLLIGVFTVTMLILLALYAAAARRIAKSWNISFALIEAQHKLARMNTTSSPSSFKPNQDSITNTLIVDSYVVAIAMTIIEVVAFIASLFYAYIVKNHGENNAA